MVEFPSPHVWLPEGTLYVPLSKQVIRGKIGWPPPLMVDTLDWHAPLRKKPRLFLLSVGHALPSCNLLSLTLLSWAYGDVVRSERSLNSNVGERRGWLSDTLGREGGRRKDRRWPRLDPKWHRVSSSIEHPPSTCTMHKSCFDHGTNNKIQFDSS